MLTEQDLKLLRLLQSDLTLSRQELGDRVGMSTSTLWRRIAELEQAGLIKDRVALLDPEKAGLPICIFVSVNMASHNEPDRLAFEDYVRAAPEIMESYSVTGAHDYILIIRARSVSEFQAFLMEKILGHASVSSASSQIALAQQKYSTALPL